MTKYILQEEFIRRFTAEAIRIAGFDTFDDGMLVADYCKDVAKSHYVDESYRDDGPEVCAENEVSCWGEE